MADYALQMAYRNFTAALIHVGGQSTYYNVSRVCTLAILATSHISIHVV